MQVYRQPCSCQMVSQTLTFVTRSLLPHWPFFSVNCLRNIVTCNAVNDTLKKCHSRSRESA